MSHTPLLISSLAAVATAVSDGSVYEVGYLTHGLNNNFQETAKSLTQARLLRKYKPLLRVELLSPTLSTATRSSDSTGSIQSDSASGQFAFERRSHVYARCKAYNGMFAIMYAWCLPKDNTATRDGYSCCWVSLVLWLDSNDENAALKAIALSTPRGGFENWLVGDASLRFDGQRPLVFYDTSETSPCLRFDNIRGEEQSLMVWDRLSELERDAVGISQHNAGNVPFDDLNFDTNLEKAKIP